jgi:hypothetical protein
MCKEFISDYSAQLVFFLQTKVSVVTNGDKGNPICNWQLLGARHGETAAKSIGCGTTVLIGAAF